MQNLCFQVSKALFLDTICTKREFDYNMGSESMFDRFWEYFGSNFGSILAPRAGLEPVLRPSSKVLVFLRAP